MILHNVLYPLLGVAWLLDALRDAVGVLVGHERTVLILSFNVSVNVLYKEENLEVNPLVEDLLRISYRELGEVVTH